MGASSGPPSAWPAVTVGDPARYRTIEQGIDEDLVLAMPRTVIAAGTVDEIPWVIQAYVTAPGPNARWWHHGPVGPELEFLLGEDRSLGGGSGAARIPDGTDFTCDVGFFGACPEVVSWVGVASERTDHIEVRMNDGSIRRVELRVDLRASPGSSGSSLPAEPKGTSSPSMSREQSFKGSTCSSGTFRPMPTLGRP